MLVVAPMYLAISATVPFSNHMILSDHWLWVVVFYALYLMVPLFKRHFHLAWHGFATESVYTRGSNSQSHGLWVYKMSHIFIGVSGGRGSEKLSSGFPPSIWLSGSRGSKWWSCGFPPPPLRKVTSWSSTLGFPFPTGFPPRGQWWIPGECIKFPESNLLVEVLHELLELIIPKVPKVCLQLMWGPPTWVRVTRG